jgi:hypothetical protein
VANLHPHYCELSVLYEYLHRLLRCIYVYMFVHIYILCRAQ